MIMIVEKVDKLLREHTGGEAFFSALDEMVSTDDNIMTALYDSIHDAHRHTFILTGKFGQRFLNWLIRTSRPCQGYIVFPGGMRDGTQRPHDYCLFKDPDNWMRKACFIDDSFYSGATRETCIKRLAVPHNLPSYVAYDGSLKKPDFLTSLYRYHKET